MTLAEALAGLDLKSGHIYRCQVGEFDVEVHVFDKKTPAVQATRTDSLVKLMKPFTVEECDLVWGDLHEPEDEIGAYPDEADTPHIVPRVKEE